MDNNYKIVKFDDSDLKWDELINNSEDSSIFFESKFLESVSSSKQEKFIVMKGDSIKAALTFSIKDNNIFLGNNCIHNGILFAKNFVDSKSLAKQNSIKYEILESAVNFIGEKYNNITLQLLPTIIDIRPFLWYNYNNNLSKYKVTVRYTTFLDTSLLVEALNVEENKSFMALGVSRRQEIRYAVKDNVVFSDNTSIECFIEHFKVFLENYDSDYKNTLNMINSLWLEYNPEKRCKVFSIKDSDGEFLYHLFFIWTDKVAYYLWGCPGIKKTKTYGGSYIMWEAMKYIKNKIGITKIDLEGINSPERGWFKLSFGGNIVPYYQLILERSSN